MAFAQKHPQLNLSGTMANNTELAQQQELNLEQTLSMRQLQSLELLQLPILELQERISLELANNPLLESSGSSLEEPTAILGDPTPATETGNTGDDEFDAYDRQVLVDTDSDWHDELPLPVQTEDKTSEDVEKRNYFFDHLTSQSSFHEQLLEELKFAKLSSIEYQIAEMIVGCIDDSGYLTTPLADTAMVFNIGLDEVELVLSKVQQLAPPGVGARTLSECLRLQLERRGENDSRLYTLVDDYLDELGKNRLPQVAKSLDISLEELQQLLSKIRDLSPHPVGALSNLPCTFVVPEVLIVSDGDKLVIDSRYSPSIKLHIAERYEEMLTDPKLNAEDRAYIREKLNSAKELIRSLDQRKRTIERIAEIIIDEQVDFFAQGVNHLKPMTMSHIASRLRLHEATISRAIANKYMQTPQGLLDFRFFFSSGYHNDSGEDISSRAIKEQLRQLVTKEDPYKPYSDDKLSEMLKTAGFSIARRTVAKYRDELNVLPTHLRKHHR